MLEARDILPESNQTLEETKEFSSDFGDIIKNLEETLKQDPEIKSIIEEIISGYDKIKCQKKEKIDKIDEMAKIEAEQEEYDHHFESLVDMIINVPSIYYREKHFKEPINTEPGKKNIIIDNNKNSGIQNQELPNKAKITLSSQFLKQKPHSTPVQAPPPQTKTPASNPLNIQRNVSRSSNPPVQITRNQDRSKNKNIQIEIPKQTKAKTQIQINKPNSNQNNNH